MSDLKPDSVLHGRYHITRTLGKGGMGMVYLAEDATLKRQVAVKENFEMGEDSTAQFLQEAHLLAALRHANLPRVTDYFVEPPYQYLVMDYLPGDDLQTLIEKEGRQPHQRVLGWADQLGDALSYLHTQKPPVTHRDIKPANIKLRTDGTAVLVDFGIAKAADAGQKTAAGAQGFTPGFAPPEQAGGGHTGPYSDQYALAATLYNLMTGVRPVDSIKRVLEDEELPPARALVPELPENISNALDHAMALQPEDRFESVGAFLTALHNPAYQWPGDLPVARKEKKPVWFFPAMGLIALLVLAILGVALVAVFKLVSPAVQPSTTSAAVIENTPIKIQSEDVPSSPTLPVEPLPTDAIMPTSTSIAKSVSTQALVAGGKWLVYSSDQEDGQTLQLWMMQIGVSHEGKPEPVSSHQLTHGPGDKSGAAWSSDGKFILFSAPAVDYKTNGLDIWVIPATGGEAVDLSLRKGDDLFAAWSPDGKTINFTNAGREDGVRQLFSMDVDGKNQTRLSLNYDESQAVWKPDMQVLLYVITASDNHYFFQRLQKFEYKTPQPYDNNQIFGRLGQVSDPAFSPDGTKLAYTRSKGRDRRIGIADYQSKGAITSLITKTGADYDPAWSADGKWIAFTSERDGNAQIYIMTSAGLLQTDVSQTTSREMDPAWQP
jgi:serine/threonine protein kinase